MSIDKVFTAIQTTLPTVNFSALANIYDKLNESTFKSAIIKYTDDGIDIIEQSNTILELKTNEFGLSTNDNKTIYINQNLQKIINNKTTTYLTSKTTPTSLSLLSLVYDPNTILAYNVSKLNISGISQCYGNISRDSDIVIGFWSKVPIKFDYFISNSLSGSYSLNGNEFVLAHDNKYIASLLNLQYEEMYCVGQNLENIYVITANLQYEYRKSFVSKNLKIMFDNTMIGFYNNCKYSKRSQICVDISNSIYTNAFIIPQINL